jgi:hypothetical protein
MNSPAAIDASHLTDALFILLDETFDTVHGAYLDRGTSLFETLATISAAEASIPVGGRCATLAAQVKHMAFYLDVIIDSVRNPNAAPADWGEVWRTVSAVDDAEWSAIKAELRANYERIKQLIAETPTWQSARQIGGAIAVIAHTAYHLGELRQALCVLKSE